MSDVRETPDQVQSPLASPAFRALRIMAPNLNAEQSAYNALLDEMDAATQALESLKLLHETHRTERDKKLRPLEQQARQLYTQILEQLEQRLLNPAGLSKKHLADIETLVQAFSIMLNPAVSPAHHATTTQHVQTQLQEDSEPNTHDKKAARDSAKQAHQAKRQQAKQTAKASSAAVNDAQNTPDPLRTLYRKLTSALHPDRASDEAERVRKTALMGQVNAAHDAKDLLSLLRLQLLTHSPDIATGTAHTTSIAKDKLKETNQQLQAQIQALRIEWQQMQTHMQKEWGLPYGNISAKSLHMALRKEAQELSAHIAYLQSDVLWLADDAFLKNWLTSEFIQQVTRRNDLFD